MSSSAISTSLRTVDGRETHEAVGMLGTYGRGRLIIVVVGT